jgi:hypothetical protein
MPALTEKVDLVGVDPSFQVESQMEIQQGCQRTGTKTAPKSLREWSSTVSSRVCLSSAGHHWWMEESCCHSSSKCERSHFGAWFGLAEDIWKVGSGIGGHGLPVALETEAGFQFVGY